MRRKFSALSSIGLAIGLALGTVALAPTSQAANVPIAGVACGSVAVPISQTVQLADKLTFTVGTGCNTMTISAVQPLDAVLSARNKTTGNVVSVNINVSAPAGNEIEISIPSQSTSPNDFEVVFWDSSNYSQTITRYEITMTSGGGVTSSGAAASAPVEVSLSLDLATSVASCTEGSSATGVMGTWLALPGADSCTSQTTPDANLLGWATTADFPVEIAQRQIDNGWGAYELFDDEGRMTAVFIPAGGATFASASNTLHPIWAS